MRTLRLLLIVPVLVMMIVVAKMAQYAAVNVFGAGLGFDLASLLGVTPVIAFYLWLSVKFPQYFKPGYANGRP